MGLESTVDIIFQKFIQEAASARVIVLHPESRYRSMLIAQLLQSNTHRVLYYAMSQDDISVESFLSGLIHDLAHQYPMFGRNLNLLPFETISFYGEVLQAAARDLSEACGGAPSYFILDEYDRSDSADDVQMFVEQLVPLLPSNCVLVINSRTLPRLPWVSMIAQKQAVLLRDAELVTRDFYGVPPSVEKQVEVFGLGPGLVLVNGTLVDDWEGHLPRLLFFYALQKPVVTRSEICAAFWPELDMDQAVNVFHVTKRRLHKALGLDLDILMHDESYYAVNATLNVDYDVLDFVSALLDARKDENNFALWQIVVDSYRGPFLQGHSEPWILARRADFRAGYLEALMHMARIRVNEKHPEHALSFLQRGVSADMANVPLHREIMLLFTSLGRRSEAVAHFNKVSEYFKHNGIAFSDMIKATHQEIMG
jgi:DNA-binding SARP family transcriptional activator